MIRIATIEDKEQVVEMARKFAEVSPYSKYIPIEKIEAMVEQGLQGDPTKLIIIIDEDYRGMIAGQVSQFIYGDVLMATELLWWVDPSHRKSKVGSELIEGFEEWAKYVGCKLITMVCLDDALGSYYEKRGYDLRERAYMKELN